ncbi:MAG: hypothetical protein KDB68_00685 [Planctomycetes bacterium]|nr:hypothetical protein [Planctomycetota bacterium]
MRLDKNYHTPIETGLRFEGVSLFNENEDKYITNIILRFRSFLPAEPFQALVAVEAEILSGKNSFHAPGDTQTKYIVRDEVGDTTGQHTLLPFRASLIDGLPMNGRTIDLRPLPALHARVYSKKGQEMGQRVWGDGFAFDDLLFSTFQVSTRPETELDDDDAPWVTMRAYRIQMQGKEGLFRTFPGDSVPHAEAMREFVNKVRDEPLPEPDYVTYPDHYLMLPNGTYKEWDKLQRAYVALAGLLRAATGLQPKLCTHLSPAEHGLDDARFCLFRDDDTMPDDWCIDSIPLANSESTLAPVLAECWPRVEHLLESGFNFAAISGWFHRHKNMSPLEQGFLNGFVFLECVKAQWLSAFDGVPISSVSRDFAGSVNRMLRSVLGHRKSVNSLTEFRNRMVHEGVSGVPFDELMRRYCELSKLCTAVFLSLAGWEGRWSAFDVNKNGRMEVISRKAWWTPPDLDVLSVLPVA